MGLEFRQLNPHFCKTYLVLRKGVGECLLIDPVLEHLEDYLAAVEAEDLTLSAVVDTHTHADHLSACSALRDLTGCEYVMHALAPAKCVSARISEGDRFKLLDKELLILHTPGHTADSMCLVFPDRVFTGDTLFLDDGGAGRDDLPGGDPDAHWRSLQRIMELPDELVVYPAHDYRGREPTSIATQKLSNPHLKDMTLSEFSLYLKELRLGPADWMKDVLSANYACALDPKAAWIPADSWACEIGGASGLSANGLEVREISARQLLEKIESGREVLLLDVREPGELRGPLGAIEGVMNVPVSGVASMIPKIAAAASGEIVAVCMSGARAHTAAQVLQKAGLAGVSVLEGGMLAWNQEGLPLDPHKAR